MFHLEKSCIWKIECIQQTHHLICLQMKKTMKKLFLLSQYLEDNSFNPELTAEQDNWEEVNHAALLENISNLDRRSQDIIRARWLEDNKLT